MLPSFDPYDTEGSMKLVEDLTTKASEIQQHMLEDILTQNAETEYLLGFLGGYSDKEIFKNKVPIVSYEDIKTYVERIANGEPSNIITTQTITELITSSATSGGQPKMIPSTAEELDRKIFLYDLLVPLMNQYVDDLDQGKGMYLHFIKPEISTPSGLPARTLLTSFYKTIKLRKRPFNKFKVSTSPYETMLCVDNEQSMYCQLLCGLVQRDEVFRVGAVFASAVLRAIKFLEDHWKELCSNIRMGVLSDWITDPSSRKAVLGILGKPNPELAELIEFECSHNTWEKIVTRLWPKTKYVDVVVTGSMAQYISTLEFYCGDLPLVSKLYGSSECFFGINLNPLSKPSDVSYTIFPNMAYFEFIPVGKKHGDDKCNVSGNCLEKQEEETPIELVEVKLGQYYEPVVTTSSGLYRYRVGDILKVTGFHNNAPLFRFIERKNVALSIDADKTTEEDLLNAVTQAKLLLEPLGCLLIDYTSYAETSSSPGHYVIYWELVMRGNEDVTKLETEAMEQCCNAMEESLDYVYRRCRSKDKSIGPLEIRLVKHGAFNALMNFCVWRGSSVSQYKTPRCIKDEGIQILNEQVVGRYFSNKSPVWKPSSMVEA